MSTHIDKVGFEIEGGWNGEALVSPFKDITLVADHSINGQTLRGDPIHATHVGEAISPPIPVADMCGDPPVPVWQEWLTSHWPNAEAKNRTNNTCGFHIHLSFLTNLDYSLITSRAALFCIRDAMKAEANRIKLPSKHEFWSRLIGLNTFCSFNTDPARQMVLRDKGNGRTARYGFLNYSYLVHGTVEFRALPTFRDAHVAVAFAKAYMGTVDDWLEANQPTEPLVRKQSFSS